MTKNYVSKKHVVGFALVLLIAALGVGFAWVVAQPTTSLRMDDQVLSSGKSSNTTVHMGETIKLDSQEDQKTAGNEDQQGIGAANFAWTGELDMCVDKAVLMTSEQAKERYGSDTKYYDEGMEEAMSTEPWTALALEIKFTNVDAVPDKSSQGNRVFTMTSFMTRQEYTQILYFNGCPDGIGVTEGYTFPLDKGQSTTVTIVYCINDSLLDGKYSYSAGINRRAIRKYCVELDVDDQRGDAS